MPSCWPQALAKGKDASYGAVWTDTPDAVPVPIPSGPSKGHLGPGVLGPGVGASPESQGWGHLKNHQLFHIEDEETEGQEDEVTPSPAVCW